MTFLTGTESIMVMNDLVGIGLYTPAEASRLLGISAGKISRWLKGHYANGKWYDALWEPEALLDDRRWALGFRDLMEVRVAAAFIKEGISAIQVRKAILLAKDLIGKDHPLATNRFRTDGREIFLHVVEEDERGIAQERLLNLFRRQYEFKGIIDPILKTVDFDDNGEPQLWWPMGRGLQVVVDPQRSFGQPIEANRSVPTAVLAVAANHLGVAEAARAYEVDVAAVNRALRYESQLEQRLAA